MGDTILIHGAAPTTLELKKIIEFESPSCILHSTGQNGVMRIPNVKTLYGTPHDVTFKESGITYTLNPTRVMFSQGNREEKRRIRSLVKPNERVADMFSGIGYFTLSAAAAGAKVHAMEINPESFSYLEKNIASNYLGRLITPELGDCRECLKGVYDRIIMGHFEAVDFLPKALEHAKIGTTLHIHGLKNYLDTEMGGVRSEVSDEARGDMKGRESDEVCPSSQKNPEERIARALSFGGFRYTLSEYKIKKYASHTWHCVWDVNLI